MRPNCFAASATIRPTAASSATSATTAIALPPSRSISRTTSSASALFERTLTIDRGAARRERVRDRAADIAPRPGDQRDAAGKFLRSLTRAILQIDRTIIERLRERATPARSSLRPSRHGGN